MDHFSSQRPRPLPLCTCTHRQHLQGRQWPGNFLQAGRQATLYLHIGLLAPLHQLVEGWGAQVVVHMGRVEPLQSFHDDLLEHKRAQHPLGSTNTKLMHIVYTCTGGSQNNSAKITDTKEITLHNKNLDLEHLLLSVMHPPAGLGETVQQTHGTEKILLYLSGLRRGQVLAHWCSQIHFSLQEM